MKDFFFSPCQKKLLRRHVGNSQKFSALRLRFRAPDDDDGSDLLQPNAGVRSINTLCIALGPDSKDDDIWLHSRLSPTDGSKPITSVTRPGPSSIAGFTDQDTLFSRAMFCSAPGD